jgi:thioredoxin-like negative regulator of GroEL
LAQIVDSEDSEFDAAAGEAEKVLVVFWREGCGPCRAMKGVIDSVAAKFAVRVVRVNADSCPKTLGRFSVCSVPVVVVLLHGREVDRIEGCVSEEFLAHRLKKCI